MKRILILLLALAGGVAAQSAGWLEGTVTDPAGAPVQAVTVKVTESATGVTQSVTTDVEGRFVVRALPAGTVRVEVAQAGFRPEVHTSVPIFASRATRHDIALRIGEVSETVDVVDQTPLLSTSTDNWGGTVKRTQLDQLPLKGRDVFDLAVQQPGAQLATSSTRSTYNGLGVPISVDGARPNMNSFRLDGISINDSSGSAPASAGGRLLGLETIQELAFIGSPFSAEYGRSGGAVINAVSRSGSNELHGRLYEYWRNSALDARNYFDSPTDPIPPLRKNHFGGMIGGPIKRNRLFFLGNVELLRENVSRTSRASTPTADIRQGILPNGTVVPVAASVKPYLALYPLPNGRNLGGGAGEYITSLLSKTRETYVTGKLDAVLSDSLRLSSRYTYDTGKQNQPDYFKSYDLAFESGYQFAQSSIQHTISPSALQELRAGYSRVFNLDGYSAIDNAVTKLGFLPGKPVGSLQVLGLDDFGGTRDSGIRTRPRKYSLAEVQLNYSLQHLHGIHSFRVGGGYGNQRFLQVADIAGQGIYNFGSIEDFLRGRPSQGDFMSPTSDTERNWRIHIFSGYAQDEMRLHRRLTLTLGVRYDAHSTPQERDGKVATLPDPLHDTTSTVGGDVFRNPSLKNFAPRASLAWDLTGGGKTIIRMGWGMFYDLLGTREMLITGNRMPPFFRRTTFANPAIFPDLLAAAASTRGSDSFDVLAYYLDQPYILKHRFAIEQRLSPTSLLRVTYAGSRGAHLSGILGETNPHVPQFLPDGRLYFAPNAPFRNPALGRFRSRITGYNSFYQGLSTEFQYQTRRSLRLQAVYTFSKSIDDVASVINRDYLNPEATGNPFNLKFSRGLSDFNARHTMSFNWSYVVPRPKSDLALVRSILGGWELHSLLVTRSSMPYSVTVGFDRANLNGQAADSGQRPNLVGGVPIKLGSTAQYFNPAAFALPDAGFFGNLGRNALEGPSLFNLDGAAQKTIFQTDRQSLRLRFELFNAFNHVNLQIPSGNTIFNNRGQVLPTAGRITGTSTTSRQIQIAARWEF